MRKNPTTSPSITPKKLWACSKQWVPWIVQKESNQSYGDAPLGRDQFASAFGRCKPRSHRWVEMWLSWDLKRGWNGLLVMQHLFGKCFTAVSQWNIFDYPSLSTMVMLGIATLVSSNWRRSLSVCLSLSVMDDQSPFIWLVWLDSASYHVNPSRK